MDKSFKSSVLVQLLAPPGFPSRHLLVHPPDVQGSIAMRVVRLVTRRPDASNSSITEVTHSHGLAPLCRLLEDNSLFIRHFCLLHLIMRFFFLHVVLNKCGLYRFRCFIQLIKVTVSFESLFFVRSVFFVFLFLFFPVSLYFIFSCLGLLGSLLLRHFLFSSSRFLIFHTFCAFSSLGFTFLFLPIFSFPASFQAFQILLLCPGMGILQFV